MLPTMFISHGSPMLAIEPGQTGKAWHELVRELDKPTAILMVSAHWATREPAVSAALSPATLHDFGGFDPSLHQVRYPAAGAPWLADAVAALLRDQGLPVGIAPERGLDHGAWVPLRWMYPDADIPVVQLSVQPYRHALWHYQLGTALRPLREQGVLVIGSGGLTHNLHDFRFDEAREDVAEAYVQAFQGWMQNALQDHDLDALLNWADRAPAARRAHPTTEHLMPLFVALGASRPQHEVRRRLAHYAGRALAMDAYLFA